MTASYEEHLLFLDFDGVLHPEGCAQRHLFCRLPLLEDLLRQMPHVPIVISSTWRVNHGFDALRARFSKDVAERVIGVTPRIQDVKEIPDQLRAYEREAEINAWLKQNRTVASAWTALDDRIYLFKPFHPRLVLTDRKQGLDSATLLKLAARLSS